MSTMLHVDADELYDLSVAARMLRIDPVRIRRWARQGRMPLIQGPDGPALPRAWVDAETGASAADPDGLLRYWLERTAPPPPEARRTLRDRSRLPVDPLLAAGEAARRVYADPVRLERLDADGTLPALRVDGESHYDPALTDLVAAGDAEEGPAAARREEVQAWARFEYATDLDAGASPPPTQTRPIPDEVAATAPRAWSIPEDVAAMDGLDAEALPETTGPEAVESPETEGAPEPEPDGSRLIRTEGFETEDEDP
jgi:hypothetical protein